MTPRAGLGIRHKLFLLFLALVLAPFLVYTAIILRQSSRNAERNARYAARQVLLQARQFMESRIEVIDRSLTYIRLDPQVTALCAADPAVYRADLSRWNDDATKLRRVVLTFGQSNPDIGGFVLYMARGLAAHTPNPEFQRLDEHRRDGWYQLTSARHVNLQWFGPRHFPQGERPRAFHAMARITDDLELSRTVGWIRVDVPERIAEEILDQAQFSASSAVFLVDEDGEPVARSARARGGADPGLLEVLRAARIPPAEAGEEPWSLRVGPRRWLTDGVPVAHTGWRLVLLVPWEDVDAFGKAVRRQLLIALVIIVPLMLPLAFLVASTSTRRIARLTAAVREYERGNLALQVLSEGGDEIGELALDLNRMASRIASLLEERYRLGQENKHSEMRALQAQINPHFLYNTLDLVNCLALRHGAPAIAEAVEALSRFYRLSLSGGAEAVSLAQELEHVEIYVRIQNMRFDDGVALRVDVPEELRGLPILKIVLQPLVENAILHGIREKESARGTIEIRARREPIAALAPDPEPEEAGAARRRGEGKVRATVEGPAGARGDVLVIEVADDGVGMTPARLEELRRGVRAAEGHGYGVRNIDRRLKVRYGQGYGLAYQSERGRGTTVTLRIPAGEEAAG